MLDRARLENPAHAGLQRLAMLPDRIQRIGFVENLERFVRGRQ
jgi:hypothetical protein